MQVSLFMDSVETKNSGKKKTVISISIGSSKRDARGSLLLGDTEVSLERKGTDGDMEKAAQLLHFYDGKVDAMGLGGTDLYLVAGNRRYVFAESAKLLKQVNDTPVLDGSGLKNTLERMAIRYLADAHVIDFNGKKAIAGGTTANHSYPESCGFAALGVGTRSHHYQTAD